MANGSPTKGRPASAAVPQHAAARLLLAAIRGKDDRAFAELRCRRRDGRWAQTFHAFDRLDTIVDDALAARDHADVYVGCAPRIRHDGTASAIEHVNVLWLDVDAPDQLDRLHRFDPAPSLVIRSGSGGVHAWWALAQPVPPSVAQRANKRLAHATGGDMRATDPARILRVPGTWNHKHEPPAAVACVHLDAVAYSANEIVTSLPDPPSLGVAPRDRSPSQERGASALLEIPATVYVPMLTGLALDRGGKVTCPFHEDRTPSLHCYDEPDKGWRCYGCDRGGSIIDFGAALYGVEPRGRSFHELRRRLARDLLERAA